MKKSFLRTIALLLMLTMLVSTLPVYANDQLSDIKGSFAEEEIQSWVDQDLIKGYSDGTFKPNKSITRAEFMVLVNRAFKYNKEAEINFKDVSSDDWFYQEVSKAIAAGYLDGFPDQTMKPQNLITRQEVAKIISIINKLEKDETAAELFKDSSSIPTWSKGYIGSVRAADLMVGYLDGSFKPLNKITRAESVVTLNNVLELIKDTEPNPDEETEEPKPTPPEDDDTVDVPTPSYPEEPVVSKPSKPVGTDYDLNVGVPESEQNFPAVDYGENAADDTLKNIAATNPFIKILDGFDQVWSMNQPAWRNGEALTVPGANGNIAKYGDGPTVYFDGYKNDETKVVAEKKTYANEEIRNEDTWVANIKYVEEVTQNRTDEEALAAYYDDQRDKIYSMIDGFGPLANAYVDIVKPVTSVVRNVEDMNKLLEETTVEDQSQGLGNATNSELAEAMDLVSLIRFRNPSSSNPSKYFYSSPRPWRMNSNGEVKEKVDENGLPVWETIGSGEKVSEPLPSGGKKETGERHYQQYETNVEVIPALRYVRRIAEDGRGKDGAFPSGHTSASYLSTFGFAYATPERFSEFLTRAAQMGENRIVTGMHSPLDVIGGRIQSTAMTAYAFNKAENREVLDKAYKNAGEVFGKLAASKNMSLYEYAHTVTEDYTFENAYDEQKWENHDANKAFYREKMTYGLPQTGVKGLAPEVPKGAEVLLETRQPYLTDQQRREILYTTSIDSGYPVLDESNGWGRIDLVTAADGYGAFLNNVTVDMDASLGRFNAQDWWRNNIYGKGMLTKKGTGTLTLTGDNSFTGGTLLQEGTLEAQSSTAFGNGDLFVENGSVLVSADETLQLNGEFTIEAGNLDIAMDNNNIQMDVDGIAYLDGGNVNLDLSNYEVGNGTSFTLLTADDVIGKFDSVTAEGYDVNVTYQPNSITVHLEAK
ncbi:S-layer homology domain-containing protein [Cytobacillus gottheilii]|uniref:S-layer homology domain-containing protein n=1 Tax=Cytobacillus gottheilii TaxID=859144 RepID=UPI002494273C|nr:S-layer homology domain-containing protein [Cytobacillus gottheilii]